MATEPVPRGDIEMASSSDRPPRQSRRDPRRTWRRVLDTVVIATIPEVRRERQRRNFDEPDNQFALWDDGDEVKTIRESYTCCPPPIFVPIMSLAQVLTFIIYAAKLKDVTLDRGGVDFNSPFIYDPVKRHQAWRFLSYCLLHYGAFHLVTNIILQVTLGCILELQHKVWRVAPVYILGVLAGSLTSSVFDAFVFLVGASGGVYALLGGHLATVIINWEEMQRDWKKSVGKIITSGVFRLGVIGILVIADTGMAIYTRYTAASNEKRVSYAAHIGSFLAGIFTGVLFLRNLKIRRWEKIVCVVFVCAYGLLMIAGILFNLFCVSPGYCPSVNL